jgi:hypothetical protein
MPTHRQSGYRIRADLLFCPACSVWQHVLTVVCLRNDQTVLVFSQKVQFQCMADAAWSVDRRYVGHDEVCVALQLRVASRRQSKCSVEVDDGWLSEVSSSLDYRRGCTSALIKTRARVSAPPRLNISYSNFLAAATFPPPQHARTPLPWLVSPVSNQRTLLGVPG